MMTRRQLLAASASALAVPAFNSATAFSAAVPFNGTFPLPPSGTFEAQAWEDGHIIFDDYAYTCMPYVVVLPGGALVATITVGNGEEGHTDQHTVIIRSADNGDTWTEVAKMESPDSPESSWGMLWHDSNTDRLYAFYTYNVNDVRFVPNSNGTGGTERADSIGVVAYRSSTDGGITWSERRHLDLPATDVDLRNPFAGAHQLQWISGHPQQHGTAAYFGMSKMGEVVAGSMFVDTEAFIVKVWETGPGVLAATQSAAIRTDGAVNEEPFVVAYPDGLLSVTFRTRTGNLGEASSIDDGASWKVRYARDYAGNIVPQPRGPSPQWMLPDGRVLLWHYNNNIVPDDAFGGPRTPVFCRIGERSDNWVVWGPPRLLMWDPAHAVNPSYPSMQIVDDDMMIVVSEKKDVRLFRFPLAGL